MHKFFVVLFAVLFLNGCASVVDATKSAGSSLESSVVDLLSSTPEGAVANKLLALTEEVTITELWKEDVSEGQGATLLKLEMAVSDAMVYVVDHTGVVFALNKDSGEVIWEVSTELPVSGGIGLGDENLFLGTTDGEILAFNLADGSTAWSSQVSSEVLSIPRFSEGVVVIKSVDGAITALSADDGKELWTFVKDVPALSLRGTSSPIIKSGGVISGYANGKLVVLRLKDGLQIWQTSVAIPRGRGAISRMVDVDADPLAGSRFIYAATFNGGLVSLDIRSGQISWRRSELSSYKQMAADWTSVFVVDVNDSIWSADQTDGTINWQQKELENRRLSPPAAVGDYIVVGDFEGYVHVLSVADGRIVGRIQVSDNAIKSVPLVDEDVFYIQDIEGRTTALQLSITEE